MISSSSSDEEDDSQPTQLPGYSGSASPDKARDWRTIELEFEAGPLGFALSRDGANTVTVIQAAGNAERNLNPGATCQLRVGDELIRVGAGRVQKDHKLVAAQIKNESRPVMLTFKRHEQAESEVEPAGPLVLRGPGDVVMACSDGLVLGRGMLGLAASDKKLSSTHSIIEATGDSAFLIRPQGKHLLLMRRANGDYGAVGRDVGVASAGLRVGDRIYLGKHEDKSREVLVEIGELDVGEAEAPSSEHSSPRSSGEVLATPTPAPAHEQPEPPMKVAVVEEAEPPEQPSTEAPAAQPRSRPKRKQKAGGGGGCCGARPA
jgi:hypothetical protein